MLPTRLRQLPIFVRQVLHKRWLLLRRAPARQPVFHLCFFSCHSYFKYLYCALHSLTEYADGVRLQVHVFNDEEQPLSAAQITAIQALMPGARVQLWPKSVGWGEAQIASIWRAYADASALADDDDFVARIDSDVFFFNADIFRAAAVSRADLIGDGHFDEFAFCQGGCYLFRVRAARRINAAIAEHGLTRMLEGIDEVVEDRAATHMAKRLGLKIWMTWFMMFPDELRNAGRLSAWQRWKFSCLHSVNKNKSLMLEAYERELYSGRFPESFSRALQTA